MQYIIKSWIAVKNKLTHDDICFQVNDKYRMEQSRTEQMI